MVVGLIAWRVELLEPLLDVAVVFLSLAITVSMQSARGSAKAAAGFGFRALQGCHCHCAISRLQNREMDVL